MRHVVTWKANDIFVNLVIILKVEVFTPMNIQVVVFWVVTPCNDTNFTLKMEAVRFSETLVSFHISIWHDNAEDYDQNLMKTFGIHVLKAKLPSVFWR
jgi:hypothetical protein